MTCCVLSFCVIISLLLSGRACILSYLNPQFSSSVIVTPFSLPFSIFFLSFSTPFSSLRLMSFPTAAILHSCFFYLPFPISSYPLVSVSSLPGNRDSFSTPVCQSINVSFSKKKSFIFRLLAHISLHHFLTSHLT